MLHWARSAIRNVVHNVQPCPCAVTFNQTYPGPCNTWIHSHNLHLESITSPSRYIRWPSASSRTLTVQSTSTVLQVPLVFSPLGPPWCPWWCFLSSAVLLLVLHVLAVIPLCPSVLLVSLAWYCCCFLELPEPRLRSAFSFFLVVDPVEELLLVMWTGACMEVGVPVSAVFRTHMANIISSELGVESRESRTSIWTIQKVNRCCVNQVRGSNFRAIVQGRERGLPNIPSEWMEGREREQ